MASADKICCRYIYAMIFLSTQLFIRAEEGIKNFVSVNDLNILIIKMIYVKYMFVWFKLRIKCH